MDLLHRATHALAADPAWQPRIEEFLVFFTWPWMLSLLTFTAVLWLPRLRDLGRVLGQTPRPARWAFAGVLLLGAALRVGWIPHAPQVYFDEFNFLETARALAESRVYHAPQVLSDSRIVPVPPAWAFTLSLAFSAGGPTLEAVCSTSVALAMASLVLAFLVGRLLFERSLPAVILALFLAVLPVHLRMSGSAALETGSLASLLLTWVALLMYRRDRRPAWLYCAALAAAWLMNWRMENPFAVFPATLVAWLVLDDRRRETLRSPHLYMTVATAYLLALPGIVADVYGMGRDFYVFYGEAAQRAQFVRENVANNLLYWVDGRIHPLPLTLLAAAGLWTWRPLRLPLAWLGWTACLHVFYTLNPSADFGVHHTLDSWRNALQPALGVLVLAAAGCEGLRSRLSARPAAAVAPLLLVGALATPSLYAGFVHAQHPWMREFAMLRAAAARMPQDAHLYLDGRHEHMRLPELRLAVAAYATGRKWSLMPQDDGRQALVDVELYREIQRERVFLYYFGQNRSDWDATRRRWLGEHLAMRVVSGLAVPGGAYTFTLYEVDGLTPQGRRRLEGDRTAFAEGGR